MERTAMWILEDAVNNVTNKVVVPADGTITISKPDSASVNAYVNDSPISTQQVNVKTGDSVYFKLANWKKAQTPIGFTYNDMNDIIMLPGRAEEAKVETVAVSNKTNEGNYMAEILNPSGMMMSGGGDGLGFGSGGGLIGGLILGSLLRQGNGGLFGGGADGGAAGAALRSPPEQVAANMSLMAAIGAVDKSVAISTATMEASQATQTLGITTQLNNVASSLASRVDNVKDVVNQNAVALMQGQAAINQNIMENRYELSKDISADGEKTRALITQQYEINLQRQLADANAQIIELRGNNQLQGAAAGITLTNTNNINQMQQQSQQQAQYAQLAHLIYGLGQNITNGAINVGSGTQTANPTNTNTSIR